MSQLLIDYVEGFSTTIHSTDTPAKITTDAPKNHGGNGIEFSPTDLFAASLGSCVLTIMAMYAKKLGVPFQGVKAKVIKNQGATPGGIGEILVHVYYPGKVELSLREKLEKAATHCPVHQSIDPKIKQEIVFHWEEGLK
jgi:putative redox protein